MNIKRINLLFLAFVFAGAIVLCLKLNLTFIGENTNKGKVQLFFDQGSGYTEEESLTAFWNKGEAKFKIGNKFKNAINVRLDPTDLDANSVNITKMKFSIIGVDIFTINAENFSEHLSILNDISQISYQSDDVHFLISGNDSSCNLDGELLNEIDKIYSKVKNVKMLLFIAFFLGIYLFLNLISNGLNSICKIIYNQIKINNDIVNVALIHWIISLFFQPMFFEFPALNLHTYNIQQFYTIVFYEMIFLVCLFLFWRCVFKIVRNFHENNNWYIEYIKCCIPCLLILFCVLLIFWPGYFCSDEYVMIYRARQWSFFSIQNYLIGLIYILSFMLIPFSSGVQIVSMLFISMIIGYIVCETKIKLKNNKIVYLLYVPFLLPACLIMNFRTLNSTIGAYLEILLLFRIIVIKYRNIEISKKELLRLSFLVSIQPVLREDGIFFILAPLLICFIFGTKINRRYKYVFILGTIAFVMLLKVPQNISLEREFGVPKRHTIQCFSRLVYGPLIAANSISDKDEIESINKIFSVEKYKKSKSMGEAEAVAAESLNVNINKKDVNDFVLGCAKLILKYPKVYLQQQWKIFLNASSLSCTEANTQPSSDMFDHDENYEYHNELSILEKNTVMFKPVNVEIRKMVINGLEGKEPNDWTKNTICHSIFWNLIPPLLFLLFFAIWSIKKFVCSKNRLFISISMLALARIPILFLTAPYAQFMYWFRFYLMGNLIMIFFIVTKVCMIKQNKLK